MTDKEKSDEDAWLDYMLNLQPELTEEEQKQKIEQLHENVDKISKLGLSPTLDSIY